MNQPTFIQQFFENKLDGLTALKSNTSKNKFLFKANLKNFIATAQTAHLLLPQQHKPTQRQKQKSRFSNALFCFVEKSIG
jgi:hypothetical protein